MRVGQGNNEMVVRLSTDISNFTQGFKQAQSVVDDFKDNTERSAKDTASFIGAMGESLTASLTVPIAGVVAQMTDMFTEFDQQMRAIEVVTEPTGLQTMESLMGSVSDKAKEIGKNSLYSAQDAADAMEIMAKAGLNTDSVLGSIDSTMKLAAGSGTDLYLATDTVTTAMRMFGYDLSDTAKSMESATEVSNVLMVAANESAIDVSELANSFRYIGPIAGSMGMSIQDVSVALSALGNNGIRGTQAGTTLRRVFQNLLRPTEEQATKMEELGISMFDANGKTKEFAEIMDTLRSVLKDGTDEQRAYLTSLIGDTTAMSGLNALVNTTTEDWDRLTDAINDSDGAIDKASETLTSGLGGSLEKTKGKLEAASLAFMERLEPSLMSVADAIGSVFESFEQADDSTKDLIISIVGVAAAIGPMLVASSLLAKGGMKIIGISKKLVGAYKAESLMYKKNILDLNALAYAEIRRGNASAAASLKSVSGLRAVSAGLKGMFLALGPAGWIMMGLTLITAILPKIINSVNNENKAHKENLKVVKEVRNENKSMYQEQLNSIKELDKARQENLNTSYVDAQAQENQGKATLDMLERQMEVDNKSAAQKEYINTLVSQLNSQYEDLNLKYNEEADTLNKTNGELRHYIENVKERAQVAAMEEYLTQLYKDQLAAKQGAAEGEAQMVEYLAAYAEQQDIVAAKEAVVEELRARALTGTKEAKEKLEEATDELELEKTILDNIDKDYKDIKKNTEAWNSELESSTNNIDYTSAAIANANISDKIDKWIGQAKRAGVEIPDGLRESIDNGSKGIVDSSEALANLIVQEMGYIPSDIENLDLKGKFGKVMEDAINNQDVTVGGFKQLERDMADGTTNALDKAANEGGAAAKKVGSTILEKYREDVNYDKAYSASADYARGAVSGINENKNSITTAYGNAGAAADKAFKGKKGLDESSPSKKAKKASEFYFIGAIQGAKGMELKLTTEYEKLGDESSKAYSKKLNDKKSWASIKKSMVNNIVKTTTLTKSEKKKIKKEHTKDGKLNGEAYAKALKKALKDKKKDVRKEAKELVKSITDAFAELKKTVGITVSKPADELKGAFSDMNKALNQYEKKVKKNFSKKEQKKFNNYQKSIKNYQKQIASYYNQLPALYDKLDAANEKLEEAIQLWQDYKDSVYDAFKSFGSIASIEMTDTVETKDFEAIAEATAKLEKVQEPLNALQSSYDEINNTMSDYASKIASSEKIITDGEQEIEKLRKEREELFNSADYFSNEESMARVDEINQTIGGLESTIIQETKSVEALQDAYEQQAGLLEQRANEIKNASYAVDAAKKELQEAEELVVESEVTKGADQYLSAMEDKLRLAKTFEEQIIQLEKMGLNETAIQEIIGMGVEQGSAYAASMLDGLTTETVAKMNAIQTQIEGIGDRLGTSLADKFYKAGIDSAQGVVNGLISQIASIEAAIGRLIAAMENAYKKAAEMHSPSKRFWRLTNNVGDAIVGSLEESEKDIQDEMINLTNIMLGNYGGSKSMDAMVNDALDTWIDKTEQFRDVLESLADVEIDLLATSGISKTDAGFKSNEEVFGTNDKGSSGDTYIFNSPKALSPEEQARAMKRAKRQKELGF